MRRGLDFEIDTLTNSIIEAASGTIFETEIVQVHDINFLRRQTRGWSFRWPMELLQPDREIVALVKKVEPANWQGLVRFSNEPDHIFMHLLESSPHNRGHSKQYDGVPGNLVAFVCKTSCERGHKGTIAFIAKTELIPHYEKILRAQRFTHNRMFITSLDALVLVRQYFPDFPFL